MPATDETLRVAFTADLSPLLAAVRQGGEAVRRFAAMADAPQVLGPAAASSGVAPDSASASRRAGNAVKGPDTQPLSEAAVRQLLPLIEQAYRRGQARPPWINR